MNLPNLASRHEQFAEEKGCCRFAQGEGGSDSRGGKSGHVRMWEIAYPSGRVESGDESGDKRGEIFTSQPRT